MTRRIQHDYSKPITFNNPGEIVIKAIDSILMGQNDIISIDHNDVSDLVTGSSKVVVSFGFGDTIKDAVRASLNVISQGYKLYDTTKAIIQFTSDKDERLENFSFEEQLSLFPKNCNITYGLKVKEKAAPKVVLVVAR